MADGYDQIAERYVEADRAQPSSVRAEYLAIALAAAAPGSRVLDLGCGTGELVTATLAERYDVVGVDISPRSIDLARVAVPGARFVVGDVASLDLADASFDLVTAFFSLIHVPTSEQPAVLAQVGRWLRPGGGLVATFDAGPAGDSRDDWLGVPMSWGSMGHAGTIDALIACGFTVRCAAVERERGDDGPEHLWIVAARP